MKIEKRTRVAVITGASSGVGKATALEFASRGIAVVLAARGVRALNETVAECRALGVEAIGVPTDTSNNDDVLHLSTEALKLTGTIDYWINNAGVLAFGEFEEMPVEVVDQVLKTNLLGYVHGSHAALNIFKRQQYGVLVNNISIGGWVSIPYGAAYSASKFGLRGLTESLQGEFSRFKHIHICAMYPGFQNTPGIYHAANYSGVKLTTPPPYSEPEKLAIAIADVVENPRNAVYPDWASPVIKTMNSIAPGLLRNTMATAVRLLQKYGPKEEAKPGNILDANRSDMRVAGKQNTTDNKLLNAGIASLAVIGIFALLTKK